MLDPIVDDASQVVEIIRHKSPSAELNLALQDNINNNNNRKPALASKMLVHQEEKKEDDRAHALPDLMKTESYVEEEGQEALWIDRSVGGEPAKRSLFKKTPSPTKKLNVLLLDNSRAATQQTAPPPPPPPPPRQALDFSIKQQKAALKSETARKLLDQALSSVDSDVGSRELLAQSAFREAQDARKLLQEKNPSRELEVALQNAKLKGEAAAKQARQMQLREERNVAGTIRDEREEEDTSLRGGPPLKLLEEQHIDSKGSADDHASRARQYLEFILPDVGIAAIPSASQSHRAAVEKMDDMSTLGFDNTYVASLPSPNKRDSLDILSIGSLNAILDAPMDKLSPEKAVAKKEEPKKKRGGLFGGVFRKKNGKETQDTISKSASSVAPKNKADNNKEVMKVTGSKAAGKKKATPKNTAKSNKAAETEVKRFVATVMVEDGVEDSMQREISNVDELRKYQAVDEQMERQLLEAMSYDDTESLTSHEGIRMHGKQTKPKKKKKTQTSNGTDEEDEMAVPPRSPPRDFEKGKTIFVSVPRGAPDILMQKSWESLVENEAVPIAEEEEVPKQVTAPRSNERLPKVFPPEPMDDAQAELGPAPSQSPASTVGDTEDDKYTVTHEEEEPKFDDRYAVVGSECESFGAFWSNCGRGGVKNMVRGESAVVPMPQLEPITTVYMNEAEDSDEGIPAPSESASIRSAAADKNASKVVSGKKGPVKPRGLGMLFARKPKVQGITTASSAPTASESAGKSSMSKSKVVPAALPVNKSKGSSAPESTVKSKGSFRSTPKSLAPAPVEKTAPKPAARSQSPKPAIKSKVASRSRSKSPKPPQVAVKAVPLTPVSNKKEPKNRTSGIFGKRNTKQAPRAIQRESSTIRPVNISVVTTDSPSLYKSLSAASFSAPSFEEYTVSADENSTMRDRDPLLVHITDQRNRPRQGLEPGTSDEPASEQRGIDP